MGIKKITQIGLTEQERRMTIDLTPFMNINPLSVQASLCDWCYSMQSCAATAHGLMANDRHVLKQHGRIPLSFPCFAVAAKCVCATLFHTVPHPGPSPFACVR